MAAADDAPQIPTVRTERLTLRPWTDDDVEPYARMCADPDVMRYIANGETLPYEVAAGQLQRFRTHWQENSFGLWAVEESETAAFVGFAGLARPLFLPEVLPAVEVGWRFARRFWRRGYATESGRAALRFGFEQGDLDRIIGIVHPGNVASWRAMTTLGMTLDRTAVQAAGGTELHVYAVARETFSRG